MVFDKEWKNYATRAVYEVLMFDSETSKSWSGRAKALLQSHNNQYYETIYALSVEIQKSVEKGNPLNDDGSLYDELLCWIIGSVEWGDVAEEIVKEQLGAKSR